ncbi:MAG: PAS domain S-box protein [Thiohalospira sp.]
MTGVRWWLAVCGIGALFVVLLYTRPLSGFAAAGTLALGVLLFLRQHWHSAGRGQGVTALLAAVPEDDPYRRLFEQSADGILLLADDRFIDCNAAAVALLGYTDKSEIVGLEPASLSPARQPDGRASAEKAEAMIRIARVGGTNRFEWQHLRSDGHAVWVEVLLTRIVLGGRPVIHTVWRDIDARKRTEEEAARAHDYLQSILDNSPVGIVFLNGERRIERFNPAFQKLSGYPASELQGLSTDALYAHPEEFQRVGEEAYPELRRGGDFATSVTLKRADGSEFTAALFGRAVNPEALSEGFIWVIQDISEYERLEADQRLLARVFESSQAIMITDADEIIERVNSAFTRITGYTAEQVVGRTPRILKSGRHGAAFYAGIFQTLKQEGHWEGEVWNRRANGEVFPVWETISQVQDESGEVTEHYIALFRDISEQKRLEAELEYQATFDRLTGAYNRQGTEAYLERELERSRRHGHAMSVAMLDVDHFKEVNDRYGHDVGDRVLKGVIRRTLERVRETDLVGRWGGEEFLLVLPETDVDAAARLAERVRNTVGEEVYEGVGRISVSLGVAELAPAETIEALVKRADDALYRAKERGRDRVERARSLS